MIIQPKIRGFICMNAHPQGCKTNIDKQIESELESGVIPDPSAEMDPSMDPNATPPEGVEGAPNGDAPQVDPGDARRGEI